MRRCVIADAAVSIPIVNLFGAAPELRTERDAAESGGGYVDEVSAGDVSIEAEFIVVKFELQRM